MIRIIKAIQGVLLTAGSAIVGKVYLTNGTYDAEVDANGNVQTISAANDGVDIGDVDVASIAAGSNLIGKVSIDQATANANEVVLKAGAAIVGSVGGLGIHVAATPAVAAAVGADVDALVATAAGTRLCGLSCQETAAGAAVFVVKHAATGATGTAVWYVTLAANSSGSWWFGSDGIACPDGVSIDYGSGTFNVTALYKIVS